MGFLKRFLSMRTKRGKKGAQERDEGQAKGYSSLPNRAACSTLALDVIHDEEGTSQQISDDAEATQLLRSSSRLYKVVSEFDYSNLPPIPHPTNSIVNNSTLSLNSTAPSQLHKPSYTVTVHPKTVIAHTEILEKSFSNDNTDTSIRLGLRSDPSVLSLLNIYDEAGELPEQAFTNTPPEPSTLEKVQIKRSGSTLRQLLGKGHEPESDISWAEQCMREADTASVDSSIGLKTPLDTHAQFDDNPSAALVSPLDTELDATSRYSSPDPQTPARASEVFEFLTNRHTKPSAHHRSLAPLHSDHSLPPSRASSRTPSTSTPSSSRSIDSDTRLAVNTATVIQQSRAHHRRVVSADTPTRIPRLTNDKQFPRSASGGHTLPPVSHAPTRSRGHTMSDLTNMGANEAHDDPFTSIPIPTKYTRYYNSSRRTSLVRQSSVKDVDKENLVHFTGVLGLHLDPVVTTSTPVSSPKVLKPSVIAPSPASSSELSPIGRQLMLDARDQRGRIKRTD